MKWQLHFSDVVDPAFALSEQERDAPKAGQAHQCIHDPGQQGILTAEDPCHKIEAEDTDQPPVGTANDRQDQCKSIQHSYSLHFDDVHGYVPPPDPDHAIPIDDRLVLG